MRAKLRLHTVVMTVVLLPAALAFGGAGDGRHTGSRHTGGASGLHAGGGHASGVTGGGAHRSAGGGNLGAIRGGGNHAGGTGGGPLGAIHGGGNHGGAVGGGPLGAILGGGNHAGGVGGHRGAVAGGGHGPDRNGFGRNNFPGGDLFNNNHHGHHHAGNWNNGAWNNGGFNNGGWNRFNPWWGVAGLGGLGLGFGAGSAWGANNGVPLYGYNNYYGDGPVGGNFLTSDGTYFSASDSPGNAVANAGPAPTLGGNAVGPGAFLDQGDLDFKAGKYQQAARDWQHALLDDPQNGGIMLLMAQTLFALGQYEQAAGATQSAMQMLPSDKWGIVVANYKDVYGNIEDYTRQLKALEKARDAEPESPALRFLLGFHFGYLGYEKQAIRELDKALTLAPKDLGAHKVRDIFAAKWPEAPPLPAAAQAAAARGPVPADGP